MHVVQQTRNSTIDLLNALPHSEEALHSCLKQLDSAVSCLRRQIQLPLDIIEHFREDIKTETQGKILADHVKVLTFRKGEDFFEASYGYGVSTKFQVNFPPNSEDPDFIMFSVQGIQGLYL